MTEELKAFEAWVNKEWNVSYADLHPISDPLKKAFQAGAKHEREKQAAHNSMKLCSEALIKMKRPPRACRGSGHVLNPQNELECTNYTW